MTEASRTEQTGEHPETPENVQELSDTLDFKITKGNLLIKLI